MSQMKRVVEVVLCMYKEGETVWAIQRYLDKRGVNQSIAEINNLINLVNAPYTNKWEDFSQTSRQTQ